MNDTIFDGAGAPGRIVILDSYGLFHHRGVPCLTYSSGSLSSATMSVDSPRDVAEHLDPETLARCARLACEVAIAPTTARGKG